jgi:oligoribonuclease NrnB/cAMP/cGMP phosphodiesterase (DHH superfamily)
MLVIYHANCTDGFGAAFAFYKRFGKSPNVELEFHPGVYNQVPPDVKGKDVYLVDFSYPREVISAMCKEASWVTVIDHHKTAIEGLAGLDDVETNLSLHLSTDHSGAMLAWNYCFPTVSPPTLLDHIEDRDLWRFKLPGTREIIAALYSYPFDFEVWSELNTSALYSDGIPLLRSDRKRMEDLLKQPERRTLIGGYNVRVVNAPPYLASEVGHLLCDGEPFAATYYDGPHHRHFSLRSAKDGLDVEAIAQQYGGGGHYHASAFKVPLPEVLL